MHILSSSSVSGNMTVSNILRHANSVIKEGKLSDAIQLMEEALNMDFDSKEVITSLKYANYWLDRLGNNEYANPEDMEAFEYGQYLMEQWNSFESFVQKSTDSPCEDCLFALRMYVFNQALTAFLRCAEHEEENSVLFLSISRCYRNIGKPEQAVLFLKQALQHNRQDAAILAELADVYAMMGELNSAKALFRESFFIDPQKVDCSRIESELFTRLYKQVQKAGYSEPECREWVPVYGVLYGVFSVKRDLRPVEFGQLQQSVYQLEQEIRQASKEEKKIILPRLINRYFWLIDQFVRMSSAQEKKEEVLLKLRNLHPEIYQHYVG